MKVKNLLILLLSVFLFFFIFTGCDDLDIPGTGDGPVITLNGEDAVTVLQHETYTDPGATAVDTTDGDLSDSIEVDNPVDTDIPGTYTVTYTCTNSAGDTSTAERSVTVQDVPDNLLGTVALAENYAVLDVTFSAPSRSIYTGSGKFRILETDITITSATWNSETGNITIQSAIVDLNGESASFTASGTFTDGVFSGTVVFNVGSVTIQGTVYAVDNEPESATQAEITRFVGAFWGESYGSWNMTITDGAIYGTYAGYHTSDVFIGTEIDNSLTITSEEGESLAVGTISGDSIGGTWAYNGPASDYYTVRGSWAGVRVDDSTGDPVHSLPIKPSDGKYIEIVGEAMMPLDVLAYDASYADGTYTDPGVDGVVLEITTVVADPSYKSSTYTFTDYEDSTYSIEVDGTWVSGGPVEPAVDVDVDIDLTFTEGTDTTTMLGDFNVSGSAAPPELTGTFSIGGNDVNLMLLESWYENYFF